MKIEQADASDLEYVRIITIETIKAVFPRYYPKGAVDFFLLYHSDKHITEDIISSRVHLLEDANTPVGTVTIMDNEIRRFLCFRHIKGRDTATHCSITQKS